MQTIHLPCSNWANSCGKLVCVQVLRPSLCTAAPVSQQVPRDEQQGNVAAQTSRGHFIPACLPRNPELPLRCPGAALIPTNAAPHAGNCKQHHTDPPPRPLFVSWLGKFTYYFPAEPQVSLHTHTAGCPLRGLFLQSLRLTGSFLPPPAERHPESPPHLQAQKGTSLGHQEPPGTRTLLASGGPLPKGEDKEKGGAASNLTLLHTWPSA